MLGFHLGAGFGVLPPEGFASEPLPEGQGAQCTCSSSSVKSTFNWLWGGGQGGAGKGSCLWRQRLSLGTTRAQIPSSGATLVTSVIGKHSPNHSVSVDTEARSIPAS